MATVAHHHQPTSALSPTNLDRSLDTNRSASVSAPAPMPSTQPAAASAAPKKGKSKKPTDPSEQQKQIQAKIAQLELDAAGDREQEAEIGAYCPLRNPQACRCHTQESAVCVPPLHKHAAHFMGFHGLSMWHRYPQHPAWSPF